MFYLKTFVNLKNNKLNKSFYSIFIESVVNVADNSGVRTGKCINLKSYSRHRGTKFANIVKISAKRVKKGKKYAKSDICEGVFIRKKKMYQRDTGLSFKCQDNSIILVDNKKLPIASRIHGIISKEIKHYDLFPKIVLMTRTKL